MFLLKKIPIFIFSAENVWGEDGPVSQSGRRNQGANPSVGIPEADDSGEETAKEKRLETSAQNSN